MVAAAARSCPVCGTVFIADIDLPEVLEGDLVAVDRAAVLRRRIAALPRWRQLQWAGVDPERLRLVAEIRGYLPGWAYWQQRRAA